MCAPCGPSCLRQKETAGKKVIALTSGSLRSSRFFPFPGKRRSRPGVTKTMGRSGEEVTEKEEKVGRKKIRL